MIIKKKIKKSCQKKNKNQFENFYYHIDDKKKICVEGDTLK